MGKIRMSQEEMISALDKAGGMLLVAAMRDSTIREAMELVINVNISLGEIAEIKWCEQDAQIERR